MRRATLTLTLALALAGCAPTPLEGHFSCALDSECPDGWSCRADGLCYATPGGDADGGLDAGEPDGSTPDASVDAGLDGGGCLPATTDVDLLLMIDSSGSMIEEQAQLAMSFPRLVEMLVTGDYTGDGIADVAPLESLHVGVITADMGTLGVSVATCPNAMHGDDGVLRTDGNPMIGACMPTYPSFLDYMAPGGQLQLTQSMACLTTNRTNGCGFEQQLEAVLKAVTPSSSPVRFFNNTTGHADGANAEFLRADSVLVTLLISDEDDCSTDNPQLFEPTSGPFVGTNLNLRCTQHADQLRPIGRYVAGLTMAHPPERLVFASLVGLPPSLEGESYADILGNPEMQYRIDPTDASRVRPACGEGTSSRADPGRRYVEVARGLDTAGAGVVVHSICRPSFEPTWVAIMRELGERSMPTCQ